MAAFMLARVSATKSVATLFYAQAVDQPLTLIQCSSQEEFYEDLLKYQASHRRSDSQQWCSGIMECA